MYIYLLKPPHLYLFWSYLLFCFELQAKNKIEIKNFKTAKYEIHEASSRYNCKSYKRYQNPFISQFKLEYYGIGDVV